MNKVGLEPTRVRAMAVLLCTAYFASHLNRHHVIDADIPIFVLVHVSTSPPLQRLQMRHWLVLVWWCSCTYLTSIFNTGLLFPHYLLHTHVLIYLVSSAKLKDLLRSSRTRTCNYPLRTPNPFLVSYTITYIRRCESRTHSLPTLYLYRFSQLTAAKLLSKSPNCRSRTCFLRLRFLRRSDTTSIPWKL